MRNSARYLKRKWGVAVKHGLYHHNGTWYHRLTLFPAALFDPRGYIRFETHDEYLKHPQLAHGAHLHVAGGISSMPGYVPMAASEKLEQRPAAESEGESLRVTRRRSVSTKGAMSFLSPEEIAVGAKYREGSTRTVRVNIYERSRKARRQCIAHHGLACTVCGFEFKKRFGVLGNGFIHVHHLRDLASIGAQYEVDPKNDLRPICPNCHSMIHRRSPPYSIEELKDLIAAKREPHV